jgi:hypothetical protein
MQNSDTSLHCTVCGCKQEKAHVLTEIQLEVISKYLREDGTPEDMNGLWRKTREFLCENCFKDYARVLSDFYAAHQKSIT